MSKDELGIRLKGLIQGMWFPSETEAPWTVPTWTLETTDAAELRRVLRRAEDAAIAEIGLDDLIANIEQRCQGYGDEGKAIAQQHQAIANFLKAHCDRVHVFRIGQVTVDILVVGKTTDGYVALQTQSVET